MAIKDMVTGIDNSTLDLARVVGFLGVIVFCSNSLWTVYHTMLFDPQAFGVGFGALVAGVGAMLKLKENTEPKPQ